MDQLNISVAGFGTVASGLVKILAENKDWIRRRIGKDINIRAVLVRDLEKKRSVALGPDTLLTSDLNAFLAVQNVDVVVELIGGLTTAQTIITKALESGRHVVTANKALLAERGLELLELAKVNGRTISYEASIAGGIPIVQTLKESLAGNRIKHITGILNGTANYILSEMTAKGMDFNTALSMAQDKGYAEADPTLDIQGIDAAHKLVLLIRLAYGRDYPFQELHTEGISGVDPYDIEVAREFGYRIKLLAQVKEKSGRLQAGVFPALIRDDHILAKVDGPFNSILLEGNAVGPIMLYGQGAGDLPTGSAVLADIMSLAAHRTLTSTGFVDETLPRADMIEPDLTVTRHYIRLSVLDRSGVLAAIAGAMGERNISIAQAVQKQYPSQQGVPIVFFTHSASSKDVAAALKEINAFSFTLAPAVHYRIL